MSNRIWKLKQKGKWYGPEWETAVVVSVYFRIRKYLKVAELNLYILYT